MHTLSPNFARRWADRIQASPLGARLAHGFFWSLVGAVVSRGLALLAMILVARLLGKEEFGELAIIQSTAGVFQVFATFGLGLTATKYLAEFRIQDPARAGRILALSNLVSLVTGALAAALLVTLGPFLAEHVLAAPHLGDLLRLSGFLVALLAINAAQTGALIGLEAFRARALVDFAAGIASCLVIILGAWWAALPGAVWGLIVSLLFNALLNYLAVRKQAAVAGIPLLLNAWMQEMPVLLSFSLPAALTSALIMPVNWICSALLVNQPGGYADLGAFNAANQWFLALLFLPGILGQAIFPAFTEACSASNSSRAKRLLALSIKLNLAVAFPVALGLALASPLVMGFYGDTYQDSWPTMVVTVLTAALLAPLVSVGHVPIAFGRVWLGLMLHIGWGVLFIALTYALLPWGPLGLATARLVAYVVTAVWTCVLALFLLRSLDSQQVDGSA